MKQRSKEASQIRYGSADFFHITPVNLDAHIVVCAAMLAMTETVVSPTARPIILEPFACAVTDRCQMLNKKLLRSRREFSPSPNELTPNPIISTAALQKLNVASPFKM
jgi:hypothetical protein